MRSTSFAAIALALASFGDAFLYPVLPANSSAVGIPVVWVGILLSVNRFVRIGVNGLMVVLIDRFGLRAIMICAVSLAILSTGGYAFANGLIAWVALRICWGLAFSAMRIGTLGYALTAQPKGLALGVSRSIQEVGPMMALLATPLLLSMFSLQETFVLLAAASLPALYFAIKLPRDNRKPILQQNKFSGNFPSLFNSITFTTAMLIEGMLVVVLALMFLTSSENISLLQATTLAALYLGYRRVCLIVFSPAGGWLADKFSTEEVFITTLFMTVFGLFMMAFGYIGSGAVIVFTFYSINAAITPGHSAKDKPHALVAVAENATWRDSGAALGTLAGGLLLSSSHFNSIFLFITFVLAVLVVTYLVRTRRTLKTFYLWK